MRKKRSVWAIILSVAVAIILTVTVFVCVKQTNQKMTQYSFNELTTKTQTVAKEFYDATRSDTIILNAMAKLIAEQIDESESAVLRVMNSFDFNNSFVSQIQLLTPDNRLLLQNGKHISTDGTLDFQTEQKKGSYISNREQGIENPKDYVLRNAVPIVKNEEVVAILYGVASLTELSEQYTPNLYDGHSFLLGVDGTTGDLLFDSIHKKLENLSDWSNRKILLGFSFEEMLENLKEGKSGDLSSVSETLGEPVYMHYEPVGVNNWTVCLGVTENAALAGTRSCTEGLYIMAVIIGATLLCYTAVMVWYLVSVNREIYRMSITDQGTKLLNRHAYELYLKKHQAHHSPINTCIYIDANGLHEINNQYGHAEGDKMLLTVAEALQKEFHHTDIYRIGGDEFVILLKHGNQEACEEKMQEVLRQLTPSGYSVSYGIACKTKETELAQLIKEADQAMLDYKKAYYASQNRTPR